MGENKLSIYILSDQKLRGEIIRDLLNSSLASSYNISLLGTGSFQTIPSTEHKPIFIIDFIALNKTPRLIIDMVKKSHEDAKIIAMHLYRNNSLIDPLFDMGIDGYIYCEPSRNELIAAVHSVINHKRYTPTYPGTK